MAAGGVTSLADVLAFIAGCSDEDIERIVHAIVERPAPLVDLAPGWEDHAVQRARDAGLFKPRGS